MTGPQQFRKKPVVIEAMQWTGDLPSLVGLLGGGYDPRYERVIDGDDPNRTCGRHDWRAIKESAVSDRLTINTLEGPLSASPGDWIIKGVAGEFYPCKPDIFAATYDAVEAEPDTVTGGEQ